MEIADINLTDNGKVEVTFEDDDNETCQVLTISKRDAWLIAKFCTDNLSYANNPSKSDT